MKTNDLDYFRRREQQERATAERCDDSSVRRVHLEMADRYSALARQVPARTSIHL